MDRRSLLVPLALPELLDNSARTYRSLGLAIFRESAVPMAMFYLVIVFVAEFVLPGAFETQDPESIAVQAGEVAAAMGITVFAALPLLLIGLSYTSGLISRITADHLLGHALDLRTARAAARSSLWTLLAVHLRTMMVSVLMVAASFGLLIASASLESQADAGWLILFGAVASLGLGIGGLTFPVIASRYALAPAVVVLEGLGSSAAVRRAVALCRRSPPHSSGYDAFVSIWILVGVLILIVYGGSAIGIEMVGLSWLAESSLRDTTVGGALLKAVELLPWYLALWTVVPLWCTICTIHYFDRRIRLEGYDIELLEQDARRSLRTSRFEL